MEITNDGNLTIAGLRTELSYVNAKTNIVAVDAGQILRAVADLPVAR